MNFALRQFRREDFETLWRIDQECFAPGLAYSRMELAAYIRLRGSFTVVAEPKSIVESRAQILGFIVAQANRRGIGHILTIDVPAANRRLGVGSKLLANAEERFS